MPVTVAQYLSRTTKSIHVCFTNQTKNAGFITNVPPDDGDYCHLDRYFITLLWLYSVNYFR